MDIIHIAKADCDKSPGGVDCNYIRLGNSGLKVYRRAETRDRAARNQRRLAAYAPRVIADDVTVIIAGRSYPAYETEHAQTPKRGTAEWRQAYYDAEVLCSELEEIYDLVWRDSHGGNVGYLNGRCVIIDTADRLFEEKD